MHRHVATDKHIRNREEAKNKATCYQQNILKINHLTEQRKGYAIDGEVKMFRLKALKAVCIANISISSFFELRGWIEEYTRTGMTLGNSKDLVRTYSKHLILSKN